MIDCWVTGLYRQEVHSMVPPFITTAPTPSGTNRTRWQWPYLRIFWLDVGQREDVETRLPCVFMSVWTRMSEARYPTGNRSFTMMDTDRNEDDDVLFIQEIYSERKWLYEIQFCLRSKCETKKICRNLKYGTKCGRPRFHHIFCPLLSQHYSHSFH